jgi:hypothetical protein
LPRQAAGRDSFWGEVTVTYSVETLVIVVVLVDVVTSGSVSVTVDGVPSAMNNVAEIMMAATSIAAARSVKLLAGAVLIQQNLWILRSVRD